MGPGFESLKLHQWPIGQVVKTAASHAVNIGSNPVWVTKVNKLVLIAARVHLFPSRTQKLSSFAPTIVAGWLAVKIGNANTNSLTTSVVRFFFMPASVHMISWFSRLILLPLKILDWTMILNSLNDSDNGYAPTDVDIDDIASDFVKQLEFLLAEGWLTTITPPPLNWTSKTEQ